MARTVLRALGLVPVGVLGLSLGLASGSELKGRPLSPIKSAIEELVPTKPGCGRHGTSVDFLATPKDAAEQAKKEEKLVLVLHVSGHFEDPRFT